MAVQTGLCRTRSETPKTGFLRTRLISGCNKRSRTGRTSRGGSYSGGGYSSGGSSGSSGTTIAIVCGVIGGWLALSFLIYVCCMVYKRSKRNNNSAGVVVNPPNRTRLSPNLNQNQSGIVLSSLPPSYPETDKPVFDVQQAMYSTQLNGTPPNQERLPNMVIRPKICYRLSC